MHQFVYISGSHHCARRISCYPDFSSYFTNREYLFYTNLQININYMNDYITHFVDRLSYSSMNCYCLQRKIYGLSCSNLCPLSHTDSGPNNSLLSVCLSVRAFVTHFSQKQIFLKFCVQLYINKFKKLMLFLF